MAAETGFEIEAVRGAAIAAYVPEIARLRTQIFRAFPYLYDGDDAYERTYLQTYVDAARSVAIVARAAGRVVGVSTGIPLAAETAEFRAPFEAADIDVRRVFYCGESVLEPAYRGRGIYNRFFAGREAHARSLGGFTTSAFCAVRRPADDPRRPPGYVPLDAVWRRFGYAERPDLVARYAWKDVGDAAETEKPMTFWLKELA